MKRSWLELHVPADSTRYDGVCMVCSSELHRTEHGFRTLSREEVLGTRVEGTIGLDVDSLVVLCSRGHEVVVKRLDKPEADLLDDADKVWNRATEPPGPAARPGDLALSAILRFHGLVMNGGLAYALEIGYDEAM